MLSIKKLRLENFRSWKSLEIDNFDKLGLCLVQGKNGSGKSSIRQAIEYLLFDSVDDIESVDDLVKDHGSNCVLEMDFELDNQSCTISKYRNHSTYNNLTKFVVNGNDITGSTRKETQKIISEFLNVSPEILFASSIFTNNSISFVEAKESDRKRVLYQILDLSKYETLQAKAKESIKDIDDNINSIEKKIFKIKSNIESSLNLKEKLTSLSKNFDKEIQNKVDRVNKQIQSLIPKSVEDIKTNVEVLRASLQNESIFDLEIDGLVSTKADKEAKLNSLLSDKNVVIPQAICPYTKKFCNELSELKEQSDDLNNRIALQEKDLYTTVSKLEELKKKKRDILKVNKDINSKLLSAEKLISEYEEFNRNVDIRKNELYVEIDKIKSEVNHYEDQLVDIESKIANLEQEVSSYNIAIEAEKEKRKKDEFWVTGFGKAGIPNMKCSKVLGSLQDKINSYLVDMNCDLYVEVSDLSELKSGEYREKVSFRIYSKNKAHNSFSSGEKQRIKIATIFSFYDLFRVTDFMILDEVLDLSLDDEGMSSVFGLLKTKSSSSGTVIAVSHSDMLKSRFDNVVAIKKNKETSYMVR